MSLSTLRQSILFDEPIVPPAFDAADELASDEWYTPAKYLDSARRVLGAIDLDPASCAIANEAIGATAFYDKATNGLLQPWHGCVWLNPPYSQPLIGRFTSTLITSYESGKVSAAICLVNNATDTAWFHTLLRCYPACFTTGRIAFWRPDRAGTQNRQGQVFFYLGCDDDRFRAEFAQWGTIVRAIGAR